MRTSAASLSEQWATINYYNGGYKRIDTEHPLEWFIGYTSPDSMALMMICSTELRPPDSSKAVSISCGKRDDGRWTLIFSLEDSELKEVFVLLCSDVIEYSRRSDSPDKAIAAVIKRYKEWDRLLKNKKSGIMDEASKRGLMGELLFLRSRINAGLPCRTAVDGWAGPDGGDQDFIYEDGWYEIKTASLSAEIVVISSIEQLGSSTEGELVLIRVDKCPISHPQAFTLNTLVRSTRSLFADDTGAIELLDEKLVKYGYIDLTDYDQQYYWSGGMTCYRVDAEFPRLTRSSIPTQITEVKYTLSISAISAWERS